MFAVQLQGIKKDIGQKDKRGKKMKMKEQETCEEIMESQVFGTYRGHREIPEEMSFDQAKMNFMAEYLCQLQDFHLTDQETFELMHSLRKHLFPEQFKDERKT